MARATWMGRSVEPYFGMSARVTACGPRDDPRRDRRSARSCASPIVVPRTTAVRGPASCAAVEPRVRRWPCARRRAPSPSIGPCAAARPAVRWSRASKSFTSPAKSRPSADGVERVDRARCRSCPRASASEERVASEPDGADDADAGDEDAGQHDDSWGYIALALYGRATQARPRILLRCETALRTSHAPCAGVRRALLRGHRRSH